MQLNILILLQNASTASIEMKAANSSVRKQKQRCPKHSDAIIKPGMKFEPVALPAGEPATQSASHLGVTGAGGRDEHPMDATGSFVKGEGKGDG